MNDKEIAELARLRHMEQLAAEHGLTYQILRGSREGVLNAVLGPTAYVKHVDIDFSKA